jgi:hypothetical protein
MNGKATFGFWPPIKNRFAAPHVTAILIRIHADYSNQKYCYDFTSSWFQLLRCPNCPTFSLSKLPIGVDWLAGIMVHRSRVIRISVLIISVLSFGQEIYCKESCIGTDGHMSSFTKDGDRRQYSQSESDFNLLQRGIHQILHRYDWFADKDCEHWVLTGCYMSC